MATIETLEGRTVHQIQSGQAVADLHSAAEELVENSFDAGATSIDVRFENHGLNTIKVQDNGNDTMTSLHDKHLAFETIHLEASSHSGLTFP